MTRIYESQTDALFARALTNNPAFAATLLTAIDGLPENGIVALSTLTRHRGDGHRGCIDLEATRADGAILLIENKIDAVYSVTNTSKTQPERYKDSVVALRNRCQKTSEPPPFELIRPYI